MILLAIPTLPQIPFHSTFTTSKLLLSLCRKLQGLSGWYHPLQSNYPFFLESHLSIFPWRENPQEQSLNRNHSRALNNFAFAFLRGRSLQSLFSGHKKSFVLASQQVRWDCRLCGKVSWHLRCLCHCTAVRSWNLFCSPSSKAICSTSRHESNLKTERCLHA